LSLGPFKVADPVRELVWEGRTMNAPFPVEAPADAAAQMVLGKLLVSQNSVPIGEINFQVRVVAPSGAAESAHAPTGEARRYRRAFVSYSSHDRAEVLRRVPMLTAAGIGYFQDLLDLKPGDRWSDELYRRIDESDVMFLFWSSAAKASEAVQKEWRYALERRGEGFIRPVLIEGPPVPPPPPELAGLHFNDSVLYFLRQES
jgi:hypothetical protein